MQVSLLVYFTNLSYFLYFLILYAERIQSLVRSIRKGNPFTSGLNRYMYGLTFLSLSSTLIYLLIAGRPMFIGLFTRDAAVYAPDHFLLLGIGAGILLFSGMVHTEFTIPGLQFGAYGALVAAMVLQTVETEPTGAGPWLTLAYIVSYAMAIPVVYPSEIQRKRLFHILESVVSFLMIVIFTGMLTGMLPPFHLAFLLFALIGDSVVLAMRWKEYVNSLVLIFLVLTVVLWLVVFGRPYALIYFLA